MVSPLIHIRSLVLSAAFILFGGQVWGATLTWNANSESDLAGYYVYQCAQLPCGRAFGSATRLATLGPVTSFNIGTPAVVQYYVITAYDAANNESAESDVATYTPISTPPPPPPAEPPPPPTSPPPTPPSSPPPSSPPPPVTPPAPPPPVSGTVSLAILGSPNLGQAWTVQATPNVTGSFSMEVWINGALDHTERRSPFCAFGENNGSCVRLQKPAGPYRVEFRVLSNGIEVTRQSVVVSAVPPAGPQAPAPPPAPTNLQIGIVQ